MAENTIVLAGAAAGALFLAANFITGDAEALAEEGGEEFVKIGKDTLEALETAVAGIPEALAGITEEADSIISGIGSTVADLTEAVGSATDVIATTAATQVIDVANDVVLTALDDLAGKFVEDLSVLSTDFSRFFSENNDGELFLLRAKIEGTGLTGLKGFVLENAGATIATSTKDYSMGYEDTPYFTVEELRVLYGDSMRLMNDQAPVPIKFMGKPFESRFSLSKSVEAFGKDIFAWKITWLRTIRERLSNVDISVLTARGVSRYFQTIDRLKVQETRLLAQFTAFEQGGEVIQNTGVDTVEVPAEPTVDLELTGTPVTSGGTVNTTVATVTPPAPKAYLGKKNGDVFEVGTAGVSLQTDKVEWYYTGMVIMQGGLGSPIYTVTDLQTGEVTSNVVGTTGTGGDLVTIKGVSTRSFDGYGGTSVPKPDARTDTPDLRKVDSNFTSQFV